MLRRLRCPHGPRECLTKEEVVVGVVEAAGEEGEVEGEVEEEVMAALNVVNRDTSPKNVPRVEWEAIKWTGFTSETRVRAVIKAVVDREGEAAGIREEVGGFKALGGLVQGIMEAIVEGVVDTGVEDEVKVEKVIVEVDMVDKDIKVEVVMEVVEEGTAEEGDEGVIERSVIDTCVILLSL